MSYAEKEEGEIQSDSEENTEDFSVEEQRIDQIREEIYRFQEEVMRSKSRRSNTHKKEKRSNKEVNGLRSPSRVAKQSASNRDNYEVVNMEIESPPNPDNSVDEEERALREMLLDQVMKKRGKVKRNTIVPTSSTASKPEAVEKPADKSLYLRPRPPLSPPSEFFLPPPPIPPCGLIMIDETSNTSDYEPYSPKPPSHPIISESQERIMSSRMRLQLQEVAPPSSEVLLEDTPRSPDEVSDAVLTSELDDTDEDVFDDELSEFELDLDDAREENKSNKKELQRLQKRQKKNQNDYNEAKRSVVKLKEELVEQERKLLVYAERGMDLTERITSLIDKSFSSSTKHLNIIKEERRKWKDKINKTASDTKQRIKSRFKRVFKGRIQKPKTIPLVEVTVQKHNNRTSDRKETQRKAEKSVMDGNVKEQPVIISNPVNKELSGKSTTIPTTRLSVDIEEIMPGARDSRSIETQLLERLMKKNKCRSTHPISTKETCDSTSDEVVDDPKPSSSSDGLDQCLSNPLIHLRSYRLYPFFPFRHITHPAVSNKLKDDIPLCPYELHGVCRDDQCKWQHDQDMRVSEVDIIKEMISYYPSLCPPTMTIDEYAKSLLVQRKVHDVAKFIAFSIPKEVRERCFNDELKRFTSV